MPTQTEEYIKQMEEEYEALREQNKNLAKGVQGTMSMFQTEQEENLIRWQLDLKEDLDRIYHLLRGDVIKEDEDGNIVYQEQEDDGLKPFNEFGVQLIMNIMAFYLNRNTILSNYSEEVINWKIYDFGTTLADLIFNRYEEMGMDTDKKIKMYPMIIKELVDSIHSAYLRAYHGGERESLRTARTVTQSEPMMRNQIGGLGGFPQTGLPSIKKKKWYNPF